ncbi:MAG: KOW domain-containing RNA-binding protein [Firmicutes bacterium]|nr:KOW domain-containing RNA-binding protein [Bacillota bacterium]
MNPQLPTLGGIAVSLAGHDKGRAYVIVKVIDHEFVAVADGEYRSIKAPKKKRVKHVKILFDAAVEGGVLAKIADGTLKDNELKRHLLKCSNAIMQ